MWRSMIFILACMSVLAEKPCAFGFRSVSTPAGLRIVTVGKGGPAEKAGLKPEDLLVHVDGMIETGSVSKGQLIQSYISTMKAFRGCGSSWTFTVQRRAGTENITVQLEEYEDPADKVAWVTELGPLDYSGSILKPLAQSDLEQVKVDVKSMKKEQGLQLLAEKNFKGEAGRGFMTQLFLGTQIKKPEVFLYFRSPKMFLRDEIFRKTSSFDDFDEQTLLKEFASYNLFQLVPDTSGSIERAANNVAGVSSALQGAAVVRLVIKSGDKVIKPIAFNDQGYWFPLNALPNASSFEVIAVDVDGAQAEFSLEPKDILAIDKP